MQGRWASWARWILPKLQALDTEQEKSERKSSEVALTDSVDPSEKEQEGEKDALKAGERTRGGRFVSKPAYNMDSFHATVETASTDRVINVTRAKAPVFDASYSR